MEAKTLEVEQNERNEARGNEHLWMSVVVCRLQRPAHFVAVALVILLSVRCMLALTLLDCLYAALPPFPLR